MSFLDKFLSAIKLNDDDYDDEEDFFEDEEDTEPEDEEIISEKPKEKKPANRFFKKMSEKAEPEAEPEKDSDSDLESKQKSVPRFQTVSNPKVTPMKRRTAEKRDMEVSVIKPTTMENTRDIADTLLAGCTVVLNLEGIDLELAQRIIDFACGTCYAIEGNLQKVSSYIFILTPSNVEISGDIQDILNGGIPAIRSDF